jgi:hypothetical protein
MSLNMPPQNSVAFRDKFLFCLMACGFAYWWGQVSLRLQADWGSSDDVGLSSVVLAFLILLGLLTYQGTIFS